MNPRHFLNQRSIAQLIAYSIEAKMNGHNAAKYDAIIKSIATYNHEAFHNRLTLPTRKFYHCPVANIPFASCIVAFHPFNRQTS
jgi:hypothetical protein